MLEERAWRADKGATAEERLREVGEILAVGLLRLRAKRAAEREHRRESSLDFTAGQSVHGRTPRGRRKSHA